MAASATRADGGDEAQFYVDEIPSKGGQCGALSTLRFRRDDGWAAGAGKRRGRAAPPPVHGSEAGIAAEGVYAVDAVDAVRGTAQAGEAG